VPLPFRAGDRHADRRTRPNTHPSHVNCRVCGTSIPLDGGKIEDGPDYATIPCTACSALVPIRRADAVYARQAQMRDGLGRAPGQRGVLGRWRRRR